MSELIIAGVGNGNIDYLPKNILSLIDSKEFFILLSDEAFIIDYLIENQKEYCILKPQDENRQFSEQILNLCNKNGQAVLLVLGQGVVDFSEFESIKELCKSNNIEFKIMPGMSLADAALRALAEKGYNLGASGVHAYNFGGSDDFQCDSRCINIFTGINTQKKASELKIALLEHYSGETLVYVVKLSKDTETSEIRLTELDQIKEYTRGTCIIINTVPFSELSIYDMPEFLHIIEILRSPKGCPWDRAQTHESLKRSLIEECYEVIEAVELGDKDKMCEELGDVLLNIALHAQIAKENDEFTMLQIIDGISKKIVSRHTHVFSGVIATTVDEINKNWEEIKKAEKNYTSQTDILKSVPKQFPALMRSEKVQKKALKVKYGYLDAENAYDELQNLVAELRETLSCEGKEQIETILGKIFFATVNIAMQSKIDPEEALTKTTEKFIKNFEQTEKQSSF